MAYASAVALTVQDIDRDGISSDEDLVAADETHGNKFADNGRTFLRVVNASAGDIVVTVHAERTIDGLVVPDLEVTVKATGDEDGLDDLFIGPFTSNFRQTDGYVWCEYDDVTTFTVGAFRI